MFETRIHGRGGQGVVTAAEMLSVASFREGKYSQAFPTFGSERMGAPVVSFCRWDDKPIRTREPVINPNALIIQDASLIPQINIFDGLDRQGYVLINSDRGIDNLGIEMYLRNVPADHCYVIPAVKLALHYIGRPIPNAVLLGAFAGVTRLLTIDAVVQAVQDRFPGRLGEANVAAAKAAYHLILERQELPYVETA